MNNINIESDKNDVLKNGDAQNVPSLSIFCVDSMDVKARVTFDGCEIDGFQLTNWFDELTEEDTGIDAVFEVLFKHIVKSRNESDEQKNINN
jgi:hypothetical protein